MSEDMDSAAAQWHAALASGDVDWDCFTSWLEADPRHRQAMDQIASLDDDITEHRDRLATLLAANDDAAFEGYDEMALTSGKPRRWPWLAGVVGGSIAAAVTLNVLSPAEVPDRIWRTADASRAIALGDGVGVTLAPHSTLTARQGHPEQLALKGAGYFVVEHRINRPLTISAGDYVVRDIGTRFEISRDDGSSTVRVAVAEGSIALTHASSPPIQVTAGTSVIARGGFADVEQIAPMSVASWRRGQLVYSSAPLSLVTADISRYAGLRVTADPSITDRQFSGTLTIGDGAALADEVAALLDLHVRRDSSGARLEPRR